ncbi:MAG: hypothetical protein LBL50_03165 [Candidatus Margulisbacteria bacterium]|jgi:hypothetical protein|nr:hypothetical protein [Candidatus Margulisiibacteriota bacterium]
MPVLSADYLENRRAWGRGLALFLIFSFVAVNLFLSVYAIAHFGHRHTQDGAHSGCMVCLVTQVAQNLNLKLFVSSAPALAILFFPVAIIVLNKPHAGALSNATPVSLKVRLNN